MMSPQSVTRQPPQKVKTEVALKSPPSSVTDGSQQDTESVRGRQLGRGSSDGAKEEGGSGDEVESAETKVTNGHRKRKRSRKGLDKKYHCPHDGCGKNYSRAEHLYRHQLNHTPKHIYHCDYPDCQRTFVRQDLCARHRERHTARGSHLQRKDTYLHNVDTAPRPFPGNMQHDQSNHRFQPLYEHTAMQSNNPANRGPHLPMPLEIPLPSVRSTMPAPLQMSGHTRSTSSTPIGEQYRSPTAFQSPTIPGYGTMNNLNRSNSDGQYYHNPNNAGYDSPNTIRAVSISGFGANQSNADHGQMNDSHFHRPISSSPRILRNNALSTGNSYLSRNDGSEAYAPSIQNYPSHSTSNNEGYINHNQQPSHVTIPPLPFPPISTSSPVAIQGSFPNLPDQSREGSVAGMMNAEMRNSPVRETEPIFSNDGYARSPHTMADDFTAWLFDQPYPSACNELMHGSLMNEPIAYIAESPTSTTHVLNPPPTKHPMAVTSILDAGLPQTILSEEKRSDLIRLIETQFNERDHAPVSKEKVKLLDGNRDAEDHCLSLKRLQLYIWSYWYHFNPQLPILHKATFSAESCPNLLLIAVIAIGASCLDKTYGEDVTEDASQLATFLAWHLRGEIFMHTDFRPPAKLWIFQTLLLLEVYEKMYSTRVLHERAHIHHATTLTLMRRGSSLRGRTPLDSPPSFNNRDNKFDPAVANTPDRWWNHWITSEATRRVAFAAFIIDSTHATMFGHGATMVAHEMRLPLPCDEALWAATSGVEVARIEAELQSEGFKPINFLDGLKGTLAGRPVRTNSFGRTAIMAGLLSVSWHLHQRDLQVSSLGVTSSLGGKMIWRGALTKAFDYWKQEFDTCVAKENRHNYPANQYSPPRKSVDDSNIFESRTVLHHLAHMAMHVDIVKCQTFALAPRLLGRTITAGEHNSAQRNIREVWAPKASARDATFYALQFLKQVLAPDLYDRADNKLDSSVKSPTTPSQPYSARDDNLLNRPWVLYFASLVVWSYGYALDGPLKNPPDLEGNPDRQRQDMRYFLGTVGGVKTPDNLETMQGRNGCLGMLILLRDMFRRCRWELMHEAANLLHNCVGLLLEGKS